MIRGFARVVTTGGLRKISEVTPGMEVLTHKSRFRKVTMVHRAAIEGDVFVWGALAASLPTNILRMSYIPEQENWTDFRGYGSSVCLSVPGIQESDWAEAITRAPLAEIPRGVAINAPQAAVVLGVMPTAMFGRILFAARSDTTIEADFVKQALAGPTMFYDLRVEEDNSYVAERVCFRWSAA